MDPYFLRSKSLGCRRWREQDLSLAIGLWGDPDVMRLIDARPMLSDEDVKQLLEKQIATEREFGIQYWPMFLIGDGDPVGAAASGLMMWLNVSTSLAFISDPVTGGVDWQKKQR